MTEQPKQTNWYLLTGIILGLLIGLILSTMIFPAVNRYVTPAQLDAVGKDIYREEIALAYTATGSLNRAIDRLMRLEQAQPASILIEQAQRLQAAGGSQQVIDALVLLAERLSPTKKHRKHKTKK